MNHLQMDEKSEPKPVTPEEISREIERFLVKVCRICSTYIYTCFHITHGIPTENTATSNIYE